MARRVSWTNNSSGHSGTYVYRAPTLDPQNLPAPAATIDPVAQGATAEWVDGETLAAGDYDYAVQDYDGQGVGVVSATVVHTVPDPYANAQIGDEIGGGIYAGTRYTSGTSYHVIFARQEGESAPIQWGVSSSVPASLGDRDEADGYSNTQLLVAEGITNFPAAEHCVNYRGGGFDDWYLPARYEIAKESGLRGHPEFSTNTTDYRWESTTYFNDAYGTRFNDGFRNRTAVTNSRRVRPMRRVPV